MKSNRSFMLPNSDYSPYQSKYDVYYIYYKIKRKDHLVFLLEKACEALLNSNLEEATIPRFSRFVVEENQYSHYFQLNLEIEGNSSRTTTVWRLLLEIAENSLKTPEIIALIKNHEHLYLHQNTNGSNDLRNSSFSGRILPYPDFLFRKVLYMLRSQMKNYYEVIQAYHLDTRIASCSLFNFAKKDLFKDIYRHSQYCYQLSLNLVHPLYKRKRSKSGKPTQLLSSFGKHEEGQVSQISQPSNISVISDELKELSVALEQMQHNDLFPDAAASRHDSARSEDGQSDKAVYISLFIDYFAKPNSDHNSSGSSFVIID